MSRKSFAPLERPLLISSATFTAASPDERRGGLLGYVRALVNGRLQLDSIAVRRTEEGRLALSFPTRPDRAGHPHFLYRPIDDRARREIEHAVLREIRKQLPPPETQT
jgi:DNA-binding cell septation regulator SpoVG